MTSNNSLKEQLIKWTGRKVTATVTNRKFKMPDENKALSDYFVDTVDTSLEAHLGDLTLVDDHVVIELVLSDGISSMNLELWPRGKHNGIWFSNEFNRAAVEIFRLTGTKVATGVRIINADDCGLERCDGHCSYTDRTEVLITLR